MNQTSVVDATYCNAIDDAPLREAGTEPPMVKFVYAT